MDSAIERGWGSSDQYGPIRSSLASHGARYTKKRRNLEGSVCCSGELEHKKWKFSSKVVDHSDPFDLCNLEEGLDLEKFGSVAKDIEDLIARRKKLCTHDFSSPCEILDVGRLSVDDNNESISHDIDLEDELVKDYLPAKPIPTVDNSPSRPIIILDSDDEDYVSEMPSFAYQGNFSMNTGGDIQKNDTVEWDYVGSQTLLGRSTLCSKNGKKKDGGVYVGVEDEDPLCSENGKKKDGGVYVGVEDEDPLCSENGKKKDGGVYVGVEDKPNEQPDADDDDVGDIWKEMSFVMEYSKDTAVDLSSGDYAVKDGEEDCDHVFISKDDIGIVCRICGYIKRSIETIIDIQFGKATRSTRTNRYEERKTVGPRSTEVQPDGTKSSKEFVVDEICAHPRHKKEMKPHQIEGFNFLLSNLVTDNPSGCILAHAPGSGKTFMIISFLQSFMAKYPHARPLVVLPKGILETWKKEFRRWRVEDLPLYDFYSAKADNRSQQLELLRRWSAERSILFLGYQQFSSIVCDNDTTNTADECRTILLTCPSILILDEGHTPRNEETNTLTALGKVQTPRKVVLSGTLYQNNVREVFNILNLVKPRFLKLDTSKAVMKRILSRASISGRHIKNFSDKEFYELVEHTLLADKKFSRKVTIIKDLREMTSKILHYYKGDFLEELPGLMDFTVLLKLHQKQKSEVAKLKKVKQKFKVSSEGSAIYMHPKLKCLRGSRERFDEKKIDTILEDLEEREGVKAKFYLKLLQLCESSGEKLLVFSHYLLPLKFLERLTIKLKGYSVGKEIFMITGDADSGMRESSMEQFNTSGDARVFFGSIRACGEGISLVGASRILVLDVHPNPSVTRQAIGRAFRPGQQRKVYTYRLVASGSPEEEDHSTCFRKESISKMWFEWNEYDGHCDFQMEEVDVRSCGDMFLETPCLSEDVISLYKR